MDPQTIYNKYVEEFGYAPKQPKHLIAYAKIHHQSKIPWKIARNLTANSIHSNEASNSKPTQSTKKQIIPKCPTIIITKKPKNNINKDIKPNEQNKHNENTEEKKADTQDDKIKKINRYSPMMCRVNFVCSTKKAKEEIYSALKTFVELQITTPHPQTIMYHFTTPNKDNDLELEFSELYLNQTIFFEHGNHPNFGNAFLNGFKDQNRKSRLFITVGSNISKLIKNICSSLDSTFPETDAGYLLHNNYLKALDLADDTKMMIKFDIISPNYYHGKKENILLIIEMINKLAVYAKESFAVMFHLHRMDQKVYPDKFELISVWPNNECLMEFFENSGVNEIVMAFKTMIIKETDDDNRKQHLMLEIYGESVGNDMFQKINEVFGDIGSVKKVNSDIGYILHPKANSSELK